MASFAIYVILIITAIVGIVFTSIVLGVINNISENLNDTNYKSKPVECTASKEKIDKVLDTIKTVRFINGILLAVFIVMFLIILAVIFFSSTKTRGSGIGGLILNRYFLFIMLFIVFVIFLSYTIIYGIMLTNLNDVNKNCFTGPASIEDTELNHFDRALSNTRTQFILCIIMTIVIAFIFGIAIFVAVKFLNKVTPKDILNKYENITQTEKEYVQSRSNNQTNQPSNLVELEN